jgi:membrane protease YdiL (CAAX protease family)
MNEPYQKEFKDLISFFSITFLWSWLLWLFPILNSIGFYVPEFLLFLSMFANFGPTVAAFIMTGIRGGVTELKALVKRGWNINFKKIWLIPTLGLIPSISFISLVIVILVEGNWVLSYSTPLVMFIPLIFIIFFMGGPLGEEYGWRGYSLDRLQSKWNALTSSIILGLIWGLWHLPLHFITGTTQEVVPFYQNLIILVLSSVIYTWIYNNTRGSILVAMLIHTAGNMSGAFIPYWVSDFGRWICFFLTLIAIILIVIIYRPIRLKKEK